MLNRTVRATVISLAARWPKGVPLTRAWAVEILYLLDKVVAPECLSLSWDVSHYYPRDHDLLAALDQLGCITMARRTILKGLEDKKTETEKFIQDNFESMTPIQQKGLIDILAQLSSCESLEQMYLWKNKMKSIAYEKERNKNRVH